MNSTSSTSTSRWRRWSAGTPCSAPRPRSSAPSTPTRPSRSPTTSPAPSARAACSTGSRPGSPSPRRPPGPGERWFGGEYTIIPNGVDVEAPPAGLKTPGEELKILFVGRPEERKGLPVLLTAFNALVEHVPSRLTVIGAERGGRQALAARPRAAALDRRPRPRLRGGAVGRAARRRRPLRAVALRRELRHGPDRGLRRRHPGDRLRRSPATATSSPTASTACWSRPATRSASPRSCSASHHEPERLAAMGAAARHSAKRYAWPRIADQVTTVYERAMAAPQPAGAAARTAHWMGLRPADGNRPIPPQKLPSLDPGARPGRQPRPPRRPPRRARRRRRARHLPHLGGAEADRRRRSRRKHRPLGPQLGPRRLRPDVDLDVLPRRVLVLDRPRRPARPPDPPPRRHLGDDDRRADVGDLAGPPRRARQGAGPRPPHRPHAGDLPGPARHPGLADPAQPGGAGAARRDHRLDHAALPLRHQAALRLQPGAADPARRRAGRAV